MGAYLSKYHIGLNSEGYIISQKSGVRYYQKKRAPSFVSKFGGGDSSYRDATFWQYFVQTNWRNGAKQLKFDDPGRYWKSSNVDTTILEELSLSKAFESAGQVAAGIKVYAMEPWRASVSWWNANYGYRQQLTVTAAAGVTVPANYPVKCTIDTAALQTAGKVRSDRKDWRIVYWNGSTWTELFRDYIDTAITFFPTQATISGGSSDSSYYVYYGFAAESTTKQPSTEADWNTVYGFYGTTPDANTVGLWHMREGTGTSLADDSANVNTGTITNPTWGTDGKLGRYLKGTNGTNRYADCGADSTLNVGSITVEGWIYFDTHLDNNVILKCGGKISLDDYNNTIRVAIYTPSGAYIKVCTQTLSTATWYHFAVTYDGATPAGSAKIYIIGTLKDSFSPSDPMNSSTEHWYLVGDPGTTPALRLQHVRISNTVRSSFPYALTSEPTTTAGAEIVTQPPSTSFDLYAGGSDGKVYKWDGTTTWTEQFDCSRLAWYEAGTDTNLIVGDVAGVETAQAQSFQLSAGQTIKGIEAYLKKNAGTPGDITVRIETNNAGVPSGTLVHANATTTISAFTTATYAWKSIDFADTFTLVASTTYWLVLKTAAAANDTNYALAADASTPGYSSGNLASSVDGGTTWSAVAGTDIYFRIKGQSTSVNCLLVSSISGSQKFYVGTGNPTGQTNGDARIYGYDGTNWSLIYTFTTTTESMVNSMTEYVANSKVYVGVGPQARVYETANFSSFTLSKDISVPQNPGYVYTMKEYNKVLYAGGGSPEFLPDQHYDGFLDIYDTTAWNILYPFDFTVVTSLEFYDAYLFIGTYHGYLYVYDTSSLNPLFSFKEQYSYAVQMPAMKYFDDKLYLALAPQTGSGETNVGIWLFDRRGLSLAHTVSGVTGYYSFATVNGALMVGTGDNGYVYKLSSTNYATQGWYQSSYFDANLPSIDKLYNEITVKHDALLAGQSVVAYYKFKESDNWTTLGTSNTVGDLEKTFSFASGTYSKKITLKIELNTSNITTTPKLTEVILQYSLYPARKWQWTMRFLAKKGLSLLDGTTETRTATQIRSDLEGLLNTQQLYTFVDIDSTSYSVLVNDIDQTSWVVNQSDVNEDEVILNLLEA